MPERTIQVGTRSRVAPVGPAYGHGALTGVASGDDSLYVCLDCGYIDTDIRVFAHEECDEESNPAVVGWRGSIENNGDGNLPEPLSDKYPL